MISIKVIFRSPRDLYNKVKESYGKEIASSRAIASQFVSFLKKIMVVALLYLILAGAYLLAIPFTVLFYLKLRWYVASSFERVFMYFLVFFFFPGLLLLGPFVNFRPQRRQIQG